MSAKGFQKIDNIDPKAQAKVIYPLANNGRELDEKELEAEQKALKFSVKYFPRISPVPGTLAFMFRNLEGGNEAIIQHLRNATKTNSAKFAKNFCILWDQMDEFSRRRIDIFDVLCDKMDIPRKKFWGVIQEGMFDYQDALTQTSLKGYQNELVELLKKMATKERNHKDRALLAEASKLISNQPMVQINEDNSDRRSVTINSNNSILPSFAKSIKKADEGVRILHNAIDEHKRLLTEGKQDYIDAELIVDQIDQEKELQVIRNLETAMQPEERLRQSVKEL